MTVRRYRIEKANPAHAKLDELPHDRARGKLVNELVALGYEVRYGSGRTATLDDPTSTPELAQLVANQRELLGKVDALLRLAEQRGLPAPAAGASPSPRPLRPTEAPVADHEVDGLMGQFSGFGSTSH